MQDETSSQDLNERLTLIESMIAEGRRSTESWGWTFLLWGVAYYVAIAWASWGGHLSVRGRAYMITESFWSGLAWPVTMICAVILTLAIGLRKGRARPGTTITRAVVSIWCCMGISMFLLFPAFALSGRLDEHAFVAIVAGMLGIANGASGLILKWRAQIICAVVWWITSALACFGTIAQLTAVFLIAIFLCQIVFGIYTMVQESRRRGQRGVVHA
jgi:hypothetical protein